MERRKSRRWLLKCVMFGVGIVITAIFDNVNRNFPNKKGNYTKIKKPVTIAIK